MKRPLFAVFYTLGLTAVFPLLIVNHRSDAASLIFAAPIISAVFAEILARTVRLTKERADNRVIWLIAAFILLSYFAKYTLRLNAAAGLTEYLSLNALYQIVLVLMFAAWEKRGTKAADVSHGHVV